MRLIDADDLTMQMIANFQQAMWGGADSDECQLALDTIGEAPIVDAVEVVRCKDCKYWEKGKDYEPYCNNWANMMTDTQAEDFCSYGERRRE